MGQITIAGVGLDPQRQVTIEAMECARQADVVFHNLGDEESRRWLRSVAAETHDVNSLYVDGMPRLVAYRAMAAAVVERARTGSNVAFLVYGHPCLLHTGVQLTLRAARDSGIPARVLAGISSVDGLLARIGVDPGFGGLQVLEACDMLMYGRVPQTDGHVIILQVACIGPRVQRAEGYTGANIDLLVQRLEAAYTSGHRVLHFRLATAGADDRLEWTTIARLSEQIWSNPSSLYVPPGRRAALEPAWIDRFGDPESESLRATRA